MVMVWLLLVEEKMPSSNLMSAASTFHICAAIFFAFSMMRSAAWLKAEPQIAAVREPPVPVPKKTLSVSPWT